MTCVIFQIDKYKFASIITSKYCHLLLMLHGCEIFEIYIIRPIFFELMFDVSIIYKIFYKSTIHVSHYLDHYDQI
jgi:hypothetical protein